MSKKNKTVMVKANEFVFSFSPEEIEQTDFYKKSPTEFNLIKNNRSVNARLLEADISGKHVKIEVEGEAYDLVVKDDLDQMLDKMGFSTVSSKHIKEIKAPMPGLVLSIAVTEGQEVKEGEKVLILEAMKMENSIMIHANAKIKKIKVKPGDAVDKNQVLVELE